MTGLTALSRANRKHGIINFSINFRSTDAAATFQRRNRLSSMRNCATKGISLKKFFSGINNGDANLQKDRLPLISGRLRLTGRLDAGEQPRFGVCPVPFDGG